MRCFVVAVFLLTSASRGPSAIAELFVVDNVEMFMCNTSTVAFPNDVNNRLFSYISGWIKLGKFLIWYKGRSCEVPSQLIVN